MSPADIVNKLWNYCSVLRDDDMSYGDYVEQLTYLLFLEMAVVAKSNWPIYKSDSRIFFLFGLVSNRGCAYVA